MLVISMTDFLGNPAQYMERAKHTAVLVENAGAPPVKISMRKSFFSSLTGLFKAKPRELGIGKGKMKLKWIGDGKVTPEELFDNKDDFFEVSDTEMLRQG